MDTLTQTQDMLGDLIAYPTISSDSNLDIIAYLAQRLEDAGARIEIFHDETGEKANLFGTLGPEADGGIVLSGHTDVVPVQDQVWASDPFQMTQKDARLYGRGSCDMKGFLAAATVMAPHYAAQVKERPIHFAFTYDEETGCFGAQELVKSLEQLGVAPSLAIVGEPTMMQVIDGHKGCYLRDFVVRSFHPKLLRKCGSNRGDHGGGRPWNDSSRISLSPDGSERSTTSRGKGSSGVEPLSFAGRLHVCSNGSDQHSCFADSNAHTAPIADVRGATPAGP
ncbi:MAG: M20/M25/M40 family metallo-hydrolase [Verrucomicrobiota bacterium]